MSINLRALSHVWATYLTLTRAKLIPGQTEEHIMSSNKASVEEQYAAIVEEPEAVTYENWSAYIDARRETYGY